MKITHLIAALIIGITASTSFAEPSDFTLPSPVVSDTNIPQYVARFGRARPVIAVVGENTFTELTDYVVPYGVLSESGVADVIALGTQAGPIQMFPALKIEPQATIDDFDLRFPEGADYVVVPAVHRTEDPKLLKWVFSQATKGATIVGVCDGVWVVANAGLLKSHRAVGHWYSFDDLERKFTDTRWIRNHRYVVDGKIITTTGVTASIPVSLALVEAIGGHDRAVDVAQKIGAKDWSSRHVSDNFRLNIGHMYTASKNWISFWSHEKIYLPLSQRINEITLALVADAYSRTYRSNAFSFSTSEAKVRTLHGLVVIPDRIDGKSADPDRKITLSAEEKPVQALDAALKDIGQTYGSRTSAFVALQMEYP